MVPFALASSCAKRGFLFCKEKRVKFQKGTRRKAIEYEKDLIKYWRDNKIFEKSVEMRPVADSYVFYYWCTAPRHITFEYC
jgi:hypothetical protein